MLNKMYLNGSKVIAILCIITTTTISHFSTSGHEVLTEEVQLQQNFNNNSSINDNNYFNSYELRVLNEFLDYNQLHSAIIIYTPSAQLLRNKTKGYPSHHDIMDNFKQLPLIRKLTENYHIQFINSLNANSYKYLFQVLITKIVIFMKYTKEDKAKEWILKSLSAKEKFNKSFVWLMLLEELQNPAADIQKNFGYFNFRLDADFTIGVYRKDSFYDLFDIYKICHTCSSPLEIEYKGNWSTENGFSITKKFRSSIAIRRNNFHNFTVKAATAILNKSPDVNLSDYDYLNNDRDFMEDDAMQRKTYQLIKLMQDLFNFTFDIYFTDKWGGELNGNFSGVSGLLQNHKVDLSLCPLRYKKARLKVFDYSRNIHTEKIHFLFRHPKHSSIRNAFLEPLADIVWWCILALIVVTILLLTIHVHMEYKLFRRLQSQQQLHTVIKNNNTTNATTNTTTTTTTAATTTKIIAATASNANITSGSDDVNAAIQFQFHSDLVVEAYHFDFIVLCIMEAILMQGPAPELFRYNSTRLLIVSVSIFSILLMQFYGAFIVSSLLSEPPRTITNLQALYNSSLEVGMENVPYNYDVFMNSTNPLVHNLYKYRICNKHTNRHNILTLEEGVKRIGKGNFAFHVAIDRAYRLLKTFLTESEFCDLQEINFHSAFTFSSGIGIRKSSPYYEFITLAIAKFQETALLTYNNKKWEVHKIDCSDIKNDAVKVDLEHFAPALVFLFAAFIFSIFILILEIIFKQIMIRNK